MTRCQPGCGCSCCAPRGSGCASGNLPNYAGQTSTWHSMLTPAGTRCCSRRSLAAPGSTCPPSRCMSTTTPPARQPTAQTCASTTCGTPGRRWLRRPGATLAELMRRLGHATAVAAMRYQQATDDRDKAIAAALSEFHAAKVVTLRPQAKDQLDPVCVRLEPLPDMATLCENLQHRVRGACLTSNGGVHQNRACTGHDDRGGGRRPQPEGSPVAD